MRRFIEIIGRDKKRRFLNIKYIEGVVELDEDHCYIYMAFNCPEAYEQVPFLVNKSYDEIIAMICKE